MNRTPAGRAPARPRTRALLAGLLALVVSLIGSVVLTAPASAATIDSSAWYQLVSWRSKKPIEVTGGSTADGAFIQQSASTAATSQQFQLVSVGNGFYELKARHSGKVVTIANTSGSRATQLTDSSSTTQQFTIANGSSGRVKLVNRSSGLALSVEGSSKDDGARLVQSADTNANNQQFTLVKVGSGATPTTPPTTAPTPAPTTPTTPTAPAAPGTWPTATGEEKVTSTRKVPVLLDGGLKRYHGISSGDQDESQPAMFELADGAVLKNVIIGTGAGDGVHCLGTCTLQNVWWEDVGEDAATFKGTKASQTFTIDGGGARKASDKVFQHNGPGTFVIKNFVAQDIGKLYRSCGNCATQFERHVVLENVTITAPAKSLVGINTNYGDTAKISGLTIVGDSAKKIVVCEWYRGILKSQGGDPDKIGSGPGAQCTYTPSAISYR